MGRGLQLRHRCLDAIHAPVEDALAVLLWWHGAGAVNDGETGAELTGRTHCAKKLSGMTETAAEKDWMSPTDVRPGGARRAMACLRELPDVQRYHPSGTAGHRRPLSTC